MSDVLESWFFERCDAIASQPAAHRSELEWQLLEFFDLRVRAGGASSALYYIDSYDIRPSRIATLLTRFAPPHVAAAARDLSLLFPDDMPQPAEAREVFMQPRLMNPSAFGLHLESDPQWAHEVLDQFCLGDDVNAFYARLQFELGQV